MDSIENAPKDGSEILGYDGISFAVIFWAGDHWHFDCSSFYPTHWCFLPEPPSEEEIINNRKLPKEVTEYYDRKLLQATPANTLALYFGECFRNQNLLYVPEDREGND